MISIWHWYSKVIVWSMADRFLSRFIKSWSVCESIAERFQHYTRQGSQMQVHLKYITVWVIWRYTLQGQINLSTDLLFIPWRHFGTGFLKTQIKMLAFDSWFCYGSASTLIKHKLTKLLSNLLFLLTLTFKYVYEKCSGNAKFCIFRQHWWSLLPVKVTNVAGAYYISSR